MPFQFSEYESPEGTTFSAVARLFSGKFVAVSNYKYLEADYITGPWTQTGTSSYGNYSLTYKVVGNYLYGSRATGQLYKYNTTQKVETQVAGVTSSISEPRFMVGTSNYLYVATLTSLTQVGTDDSLKTITNWYKNPGDRFGNLMVGDNNKLIVFGYTNNGTGYLTITEDDFQTVSIVDFSVAYTFNADFACLIDSNTVAIDTYRITLDGTLTRDTSKTFDNNHRSIGKFEDKYLYWYTGNRGTIYSYANQVQTVELAAGTRPTYSNIVLSNGCLTRAQYNETYVYSLDSNAPQPPVIGAPFLLEDEPDFVVTYKSGMLKAPGNESLLVSEEVPVGLVSKELLQSMGVPDVISTSSTWKTGDIISFPFQESELPSGFFLANGQAFNVNSPNGAALVGLSDEYKSDWGVTVTGTTVNTPDLTGGVVVSSTDTLGIDQNGVLEIDTSGIPLIKMNYAIYLGAYEEEDDGVDPTAPITPPSNAPGSLIPETGYTNKWKVFVRTTNNLSYYSVFVQKWFGTSSSSLYSAGDYINYTVRFDKYDDPSIYTFVDFIGDSGQVKNIDDIVIGDAETAATADGINIQYVATEASSRYSVTIKYLISVPSGYFVEGS